MKISEIVEVQKVAVAITRNDSAIPSVITSIRNTRLNDQGQFFIGFITIREVCFVLLRSFGVRDNYVDFRH